MSKKLVKIIREIVNIAKTLLSLCLFSSFNTKLKKLVELNCEECVIFANGPSLGKSLLKNRSLIKDRTKICVNDFADSPQFDRLKPSFYIFMDSAYWQKDVSQHFKTIRTGYYKILKDRVNWRLTIILPTAAKKWNPFSSLPRENKYINVQYQNITEAYCYKKLRFFLYRINLAMPKMQNVLVAAIFSAINYGFKKIYIIGADHSWHESIIVDDNNILHLKNVRFNDKTVECRRPFYEDPEEKKPYHMGNLFRDLSKMFEAYEELEKYSKFIGVKIYNASERSFIDAFERYKMPGRKK